MTDDELSVRLALEGRKIDYCIGEFCLIQKITLPTYGIQYAKGCIRGSISANLKVSLKFLNKLFMFFYIKINFRLVIEIS